MKKLALLLCLAAGPAFSATVSLNFVGNAGSDGTLSSTDVAGVVPVANWNNITSSGAALVDNTGASSAITATYSSGGWSNGFIGTSTADQKMMKGYLDIAGSPVTITLSNLNPAQTYQVYVYSDGDGSSSDTTTPRVGSFTLNGVTTNISDLPSAQFAGTYTAVPSGTTGAGNYTVFTISGQSSYNLTVQGASGGTDGLLRAPLNALQIDAIPEPAASALASILGLAALVRRRRCA